jgi:Zn-dependent protease with chaperone function
MDFFNAQDIARRQTRRLVILFTLAIICLVIITNILVVVTLGLLTVDEQNLEWGMLDWRLFLGVTLAVLSVIGFGSLYRISTLRGGGARVAEMLDARLVVDGRNDLYEQRVLNIVEEMAIASGTPVPPVYILDEPSINAFAAGYSTSDAVVGVTRGAIEKLSREELQGVIAHEFSHILHGDMRLNIRLMGWLHGIMVVGMMGYYLLRTAGMSRGGRRNGNGLIFLALGLIAIGATGTFFGKLIKAAVSRQREYLADASAVQYTRSADGIAGALKRIGADSEGSLLSNPSAPQISHSLFSNGLNVSASSPFATHPPLGRRISKLRPDWDGSFLVAPVIPLQAESPSVSAQEPLRDRAMTMLTVAAAAAMARAGNPDNADIAEASRIHENLPRTFLDAAHEPHGARALIYFFLLDAAVAIRNSQLAHLSQFADAGVYDELVRLEQSDSQLKPEDRLPLINIALSALRQLSHDQYQLFIRNMHSVLNAARKGLRQWLIFNLVTHHLDKVFRAGAAEETRGNRHLQQTSQTQAASVTLSLLVWLGEQQGAAAEAAFAAAQKVLTDIHIELLPADSLNLAQLETSVRELRRLCAEDKQLLLQAMAACIGHDARLTVVEQELFRTMAEILDCPVPALL